MESFWLESEAAETVEKYAEQGVGADVALRVYSCRLLGSVPQLVLHGGGNASVKTRMADFLGKINEVICVKGSGWDMATIEPAGLPAVRLGPIQSVAELDALSDEDMVNVQRSNLLDISSPNPSVETLLHAFLPHKFVDHTHANAVLALTNQTNGVSICSELYGKTVGLVPYIMPGFSLAKKGLEVYRANPECEGLILMKHGIFSFGETARESYERMIKLVSLAENRLGKGLGRLGVASESRALARPAEIAPILRGMCAPSRVDGDCQRMIATYRTTEEIKAYVEGEELSRYSQAGPVTPDHVIRTKPKPLIAPPPEDGRLEPWTSEVEARLALYQKEYRAYFDRHNRRLKTPKIALDPMPRVVLVGGLGLFGLGGSLGAASIAADLAETTVSVVAASERLGKFESIGESDIFDMEYWSLEQAKLGKTKVLPLDGRIVAITGGAGAIGSATAAAFRGEGAEVALLDINQGEVLTTADQIGGFGISCDVTQRDQVESAFEQICEKYGGVDILVSNAGRAWDGRIGEVADNVLRESFELNFFSHQNVAQVAVRIMRLQGKGGVLLFNASKQAVNPGANFGPYGLPKAATLFLSRQYAIDYGADGIRSNAVNADRIRSGLMTEDVITARAMARGVSADLYMAGNLLQTEVDARDVARAFVSLAHATKTTGAVLTVDGGNIAAALR
ncbi:MAG: (S)-1-Phenylethanol dehydrogenase [Alphaproteobacteria bacterium MarineAlpha9_Bin7]|nr:MAG: (S)-1-Phenylethanol dehydrogenase [Alphaproteobacteria bacterium MarineAlpha9_Bin7]